MLGVNLKKYFICILCIFLLTCTLCSCSVNVILEPSETPKTSAESTPSQDGASGGVYRPKVTGQIQFTYFASSQAEQDRIDAFIKAFNAKYPDVQVLKDEQDFSQYLKLMTSGEMGDVFYLKETMVYDLAVTHSGMVPLSSAWFDQFKIDSNYIYSGSNGLIDGKLYYVAPESEATHGFGLYKFGRNTDAAVAFALFACTPEGRAALNG